jgi:hypothetical protein
MCRTIRFVRHSAPAAQGHIQISRTVATSLRQSICQWSRLCRRRCRVRRASRFRLADPVYTYQPGWKRYPPSRRTSIRRGHGTRRIRQYTPAFPLGHSVDLRALSVLESIESLESVESENCWQQAASSWQHAKRKALRTSRIGPSGLPSALCAMRSALCGEWTDR